MTRACHCEKAQRLQYIRSLAGEEKHRLLDQIHITITYSVPGIFAHQTTRRTLRYAREHSNSSIKMISSTLIIVLALPLAGIAFFHLVQSIRSSRRPKDFPPGPSTVPILGNLTQIPSTKSFLKFHEWASEYGSIVGLKLGSQNVVILNDYKHVLELFDRRGAIYSSRPDSHVANDVIFKDKTHILFLPYGREWRLMRKTLQQLLRTTAVDEILPLQEAESIQTLHHLMHSPERWFDHVRRYSTAVILASVFGLRGAHCDSPRVKSFYDVQDQNAAIHELGATPPVDIFPFLKALPDSVSPWRRWARSIRSDYRKLLFKLVEDSRSSGVDCFFAKMMDAQEKKGLTEEQIAHLGGVLMEAGSDTTASTLLSFLLALSSRPNVLRKCHEEVDHVVGMDRSPTAADMPKLQYLRAVMKETLRWRPVAAGGIPHVLIQDDKYGDYVLPKGTVLFANTWSIHRTCEYADPDEFIPERFLDNEYGIAAELTGDEKDSMRRPLYGFGAGRRACSGQGLAENSLIINMAKLVWAFDISLQEHTIADDSILSGYDGGLLVCPKRFPLILKPRSLEHVAVVDSEMERVQPFLDTFKG